MENSLGTAPLLVQSQQFSNPTASAHDPYRVRWGFNPVQRSKILNARECGVGAVPFGEFFPIRSFSTPKEHHSIDWTKPKETTEVVTADDAQHILELALAGKGAQDEIDWGFQTGFYGEGDAGKMSVITHTLLPSLSFIRALPAHFGGADTFIGNACPGEDEFDQDARETCPTCWAKWLNSPACAAYIEYRAEIGMDISEELRESGKIVNRNVRPTLNELEDARKILLTAFRAGLESLAIMWQDIAEGVENGTRKDVNKLEQNYRKDLHKSKPQDRQLSDAVRLAKATNEGSTATLDKLAEMQIETNKIQIQTNKLISQLVENRVAPAAPAQIDYSMLACSDVTKTGADCQGKVVKIVDKKPFCATHPVNKPNDVPAN